MFLLLLLAMLKSMRCTTAGMVVQCLLCAGFLQLTRHDLLASNPDMGTVWLTVNKLLCVGK
jgi:hypothetical protein